MVIDPVARVAHVIQDDEVDLPDIEGIVLGPPFAPKGVEGMGIVRRVEIQVVIAGDIVLGHAAGRDDLLETPIKGQVVAHDVPLEDQALGFAVVATDEHLADRVPDVGDFPVRIGLSIAEHQALEAVSHRILDQGEIDGFWQGAGRGDPAEAQAGGALDLVNVVELGDQVRIDRGSVACGPDDEEVHVFVSRQRVAAVFGRPDDFAAVGDHDARNASLVCIKFRIAVGIQEHYAACGIGYGVAAHDVDRADVVRIFRVRPGCNQGESDGESESGMRHESVSCAIQPGRISTKTSQLVLSIRHQKNNLFSIRCRVNETSFHGYFFEPCGNFGVLMFCGIMSVRDNQRRVGIGVKDCPSPYHIAVHAGWYQVKPCFAWP